MLTRESAHRWTGGALLPRDHWLEALALLIPLFADEPDIGARRSGLRRHLAPLTSFGRHRWFDSYSTYNGLVTQIHTTSDSIDRQTFVPLHSIFLSSLVRLPSAVSVPRPLLVCLRKCCRGIVAGPFKASQKHDASPPRHLALLYRPTEDLLKLLNQSRQKIWRSDPRAPRPRE
jgi:hypothetical protein